MREIEGLSLFCHGFVFSSPRFAPLFGLCCGSLLFSKYLKSLVLKNILLGPKEV